GHEFTVRSAPGKCGCGEHVQKAMHPRVRTIERVGERVNRPDRVMQARRGFESQATRRGPAQEVRQLVDRRYRIRRQTTGTHCGERAVDFARLSFTIRWQG